MSKQDTSIQDAKPVADVEDPKRRELLRKATKLAVYTAPVLFTISQNAFGRPEAPGKTPPGKSAPERSTGDSTTMSVGIPPDPPGPG
jgi:hypothetical protein